MTDADSDGEAICVSCGAIVRTGPLTEREFFDAMHAVFRYPHRKACVETDDGWVCALDCPLNRSDRLV